MSKRDIRTVREFNQWRRIRLDEGYPAQLGRALDEVCNMAERYEKLRKLNPRQYAALCEWNLAGEGTFDDLVDKLK